MKKKYFVILLLFGLAMLFFITIGQGGFVRIHRLTKERNQIRAFNEKIREQNRNLREEIYSLKKDRGYIEEIARQKLGLVKEDEIIYQFKAPQK